jgi:putative ABC transport system substrate-binding protein
MRRRNFIALLGGAATWPLLARAQQPRRIGIMIALPEGDPEAKKWLAAFRQGLEKLGWSEGGNVLIDYRFAPAGARAPALAKELLALHPDVVLGFSTPVTAAFQRESRIVPIVFIGIADAVGQGLVPSLAHPGGNLTGLTMFEASVSGKWLSMLKEIEPQLARAGFVANPKTAPYYDFYLRAAKVVAPSLGIEPVFVPIENAAADVERAIAAFAHAGLKGGLVVLGDSTTNAHRDLIICSQPGIACRQSTGSASLSPPAASCPTGSTSSMSLGRWRCMWTAFCAAPDPPISRCSMRPSSKRLSTSKRRMLSV